MLNRIYSNIKTVRLGVWLLIIYFVIVKINEESRSFGLISFGGLGVHLDPYNIKRIPKFATQYYLQDDKENILKQLSYIDYPFIFPLSIRGSFKYFYYRFPLLEEDVSQDFCSFLKDYHYENFSAINIQYELFNGQQVTKRYSCK